MEVELQMNSSYAVSLFKPCFGKANFHKQLLTKGYINYISSDAHNTNQRKPELHITTIERKIPEYASLILGENARKLFRNREKNAKQNRD
jgi:tyrosine-protein phosphatase YwqE